MNALQKELFHLYITAPENVYVGNPDRTKCGGIYGDCDACGYQDFESAFTEIQPGGSAFTLTYPLQEKRLWVCNKCVARVREAIATQRLLLDIGFTPSTNGNNQTSRCANVNCNKALPIESSRRPTALTNYLILEGHGYVGSYHNKSGYPKEFDFLVGFCGIDCLREWAKK